MYKMKDYVNKLWDNISIYETILFLSIILYIILWYYIDLFRLYALHEHVYDLGVAIEEGYLVFHTHFTFNLFIYDLLIYGGRIFLSPMSLVMNLRIFLLFQTVFLALPALLFYYFALYHGLNKKNSLIFSIAYLLYPGLGGLNWFEWHYQVFFIFFFMLGVLLFIKSHYVVGTLVFTVAGLLKFPYLIFVFLYMLILLFEELYKKPLILDKKKIFFISVNIILPVLLLIYSYLLLQSGIYNINSYFHAGQISYTQVFTNTTSKTFTVLIIFASFSFLIFLSPKYILLFIPFFAISFLLYQWEIFPEIFFTQYDTTIILFGFIGSIDGYKNLKKKLNSVDIKKKRNLNSIKYKIKVKLNKLLRKDAYLYIFVIVILIMSLFYSPYGPFNDNGNVNSIYKYDNENSTQYNDLMKVVSLIPTNVPANEILVQNNLPEIFPRIDTYGLTPYNPLSAPLELDFNYYFFYNYTEIMPDGKFMNVTPDYILADINSLSFTSIDGPYPHNISLSMYVHHFLENKSYGILAEADGILLLERNYTGDVKYFVPIPTMSYYSQNWQFYYGDKDSFSQIYNSTVMQGVSSGPFITLPPGYYSATFNIFTNDNSSMNTFGVVLMKNYNQSIYYRNFNNSILKNNTWNKLTVTFYLNNTYNFLNFQLRSYVIEDGKIEVKSLVINQINNYSGINLLWINNNSFVH